MAMRNIIRINESKCNGCGQCVTGCAEGALAIVDGKARLVKESYCDGLGACLGECPTGALTIEQRDAAVFDEAAVTVHLGRQPAPQAPKPAHHGHSGCPGMQARQFARPAAATSSEIPSQLSHWPIQLHLAHPLAPQFQEAHLLVAADCTAYAHGAFHNELLAGKALLIACPKLDDPDGYLDKLAMLFAQARPASVTVARMEVPCCGGLIAMVLKARDLSGSALTVEELVVGVTGSLVARRNHTSPHAAASLSADRK